MLSVRNPYKNAAILRRTVKGSILFLFLISVWFAPLVHFGYIFTRLDPLAALLLPITARNLLSQALPGVAVIVSAFFFGRLFCGYLCPMGTTIDIAGTAFRKAAKIKINTLPEKLCHLKYLLLAFAAGAALFGINLFYWFTPMPLVTRFYSILIQPLTTLIGSKAAAAGRPLLSVLNAGELEYLQIAVRRFDGIYFILIFFGAVFLLELVRPHFWCRYLCPAGALLGLCSKLPFWRRRADKCIQCGVCITTCPAGAITSDGALAAHRECIACRTCVNVCPENGITFSFTGVKTPSVQGVLPARRTFIIAAGSGAGLAVIEFLDLRTILNAGSKGFIYPETFIRPPGTLPEREFLAACVRCGLCMRVCPTNALQPATFINGANFGGKFSPVMVLRHGPCEPDCNLCGIVCPSGAIRELTLKEKRWAKIGTSVIYPGRCIAWNNSKSCVVCQEVCPYGAVTIVPREIAATLPSGTYAAGSTYPVPVVNAEKCFGCGYCEQHCPVEVSAIISEPLNSLRIAEGSYEETGKERGLKLEVLDKSANTSEDIFPIEELPEGTLPPGFTD